MSRFWRQYGHVILLVSIGLAVSLSAFLGVVHWERRQIHADFKQAALQQTILLQNKLTSNIDFLRSVSALYHVTEELDANEFRNFVEEVLYHAHGIEAIAWLPKVLHQERLGYEQRAKQLQPTFEFKHYDERGNLVRASKKPHYFPVYFLEPMSSKVFSVGFDLASHPAYLQHLNHATDTGQAWMTPASQPVGAHQRSSRYMVFLPVYEDEKPVRSIAERRKYLLGFVLGVEDLAETVQHMVQYIDTQGIDITIYDASAGVVPNLVYAHYYQNRNAIRAINNRSSLRFERHFSMGGRDWVIAAEPAAGYFGMRDSWKPWAVLFIGLLVTGLMTAYSLGMTIRASKVQQLVHERTAELASKTRELKEYTDALARSNAELQQFAYVASHDLQEPLRMVASYTQLLKSRYGDKLDNDAVEFIDFAVDGVHRMSTLIKDLLEYSRVETTGKPLESVDFAAALDWATGNVRAAIEDAKASVTYDKMPVVRGDAAQLKRLLQNLLSNALKYRDRNRALEVHVSAEQDGARWKIGVHDNGIGIDAEYQDKIFEIFHRLHGRDEYPGTGIGLAICKKIVERHGGTIWVESTAGEGSTFYFTLMGE